MNTDSLESQERLDGLTPHQLIDEIREIVPQYLGEVGTGFVFAFVASLLVVKPFLALVRSTGFRMFAWYRIVVGALALVLLFMR